MKFNKGMLSASIIAAAGAMLSPATVFAHGSMEKPLSRVYNCAQGDIENLQDEACLAASKVSGKSTFYDWSGVAQGGANSDHLAVVPDGKLCSGGNSYYDGLDLVRDDWTATPIYADENGNYEFIFNGEPAPHRTKDWIFYVTKPGYNPLEPLKWSDLEEFCRLGGEVPLEPNKRYKMTCPLPDREGKHVIYNVWQRADSPEAFYTCIDVDFVQPIQGWQNKGHLTANTNLEAGDYVLFRLFDENYSDAETIRIDITAANTAADQWAYDLAVAINTQSQLAKVGVADANGNIEPVMGAAKNSIYIIEGRNLSFKIDKRKGGEPTANSWEAQLAYEKGSIVGHKGKNWRAKWWNKGEEPGTAQWGPWEEVAGVEPTPAPTAEPTPVPTAEPTPVPTAEPTPVPTAEPTPVPTAEPTPVPTAEPTPVPTAEPTPVPTAEPTPAPGIPAWDANTVYTGGKRVSHQGATYEAKWWTRGDEPGKGGKWGVWKKL